MDVRANRGLLPILIALAFACRGAEESGDTGSEPQSIMADVPDAVRVELQARAGTDVTGVAVLTPRPGGTAITVEFRGANGGYDYVAELIEGTCDQPGALVAMLSEMTAGEGGEASHERLLEEVVLDQGAPGRAIRIRGADDPAAVVACGELRAGAPTSATDR
jgi:hypothetical protein